LARTYLTALRFLGYVSDKDRSLFLSKEDELFTVKSGSTVLKSCQVKVVGKGQVVLYDTVTKVKVRIQLTGSGGKRSGQSMVRKITAVRARRALPRSSERS
jgi:hypothetical protein